VDIAIAEDLKDQSGQMTRGDIEIGGIKASLTGTWTQEADSGVLNMVLSAPGMPVSSLVALLPSLDIQLPAKSSLEGGTASAKLALTGPTSGVVISGPVGVQNTRLKGFDLGTKLSVIEKLAGLKAGPNTDIQTLSANLRMALTGTSLDDIHLVLPSVGELSGSGTISPIHALDFKMRATIRGGALVSALTPSNIPFSIVGTSTNPEFRPDVGGIAAAEINQGIKGVKAGGVDAGKAATGVLQGLFGGKKQ
jgi:AsmA protein